MGRAFERVAMMDGKETRSFESTCSVQSWNLRFSTIHGDHMDNKWRYIRMVGLDKKPIGCVDDVGNRTVEEPLRLCHLNLGMSVTLTL